MKFTSVAPKRVNSDGAFVCSRDKILYPTANHFISRIHGL